MLACGYFSQQVTRVYDGTAQPEYQQAKSHKCGIYTIDGQEDMQVGDGRTAMEDTMDDASMATEEVDEASKNTDFRKMAKIELHGVPRWLYAMTVTRSSLR
jgi:hypothetical protein